MLKTKLLSSPDDLVQKFLKALVKKISFVTSDVTLATARILVARYPRLGKENLALGKSWAKSLFQRMGFVKRATTGTI